jgi:large subunit ribosomal protein L29
MFIDAIRAMTDDEILDAIEDQKERMWLLRRDHATGELKDTNSFGRVKRDIARLKTVLHERQLAAQVAASEEENNA